MAPRDSSPASVWRLLDLARTEARALALGILFLAVGSAASLAYPLAVRAVVDGALGHAGVLGSGTTAMGRAALLMGVLALVQGAAVGLRAVLFALAGERVVLRLRTELHARILEQEIAFFDETRTGELTSRLTADTQLLQGTVTTSVSIALRNALQATGGLVLLAYTSPSLTLVMLAVVPPVALGAVFYGRRIRGLARRAQEALAAASDIAVESLAGIRTVRAFDAEEAEARRFGAALARTYDVARRRARAGAVFVGAASAGVYAASAVVLWSGGKLVARGELSVGALTSFLVYTLFVALSLGALADVWSELMRGVGAAERVFELMDRRPRVPARGGLAPASCSGRLAFRGVRFAYPGRPETPVLEGVDLEVAPGELVAVVGPSGAGKSTLGALVARLYDPDEGAVLLDGHDLRELDPRWLRRQVGFVWQEPVLFSASVGDNIRYARPGASDADVEAAARTAHAHEFVARLPGGYAAEVGERGVKLSGGQRQRIAIARAVLKDPPLLVLDEATSALDAESERLVRDALDEVAKSRATLVIAHRLSTVIHACRVVVLDRGRIVQSGTHAQLLAENGLYRRLVADQFVAG